MFNKIKQLKDLREQSKQMKSMLDEVVVVGASSGNGVMITVNGSHETLGVQVDDNLDRAKIGDHVKDALNDVNKKLQVELLKKMKDMGGLDAFKGLGL